MRAAPGAISIESNEARIAAAKRTLG
jgi:hypothetical protein